MGFARAGWKSRQLFGALRMITRIELTNFMSHAHTVIEPAAGLTVLVGPNNVGKSAVVAALQILCHNENSTYVLRHGTKQCSVKVETDDGHTIEWRRKTSPSYVIDGQTFDRLKGSGLPDELHKALRLPKVEAGTDNDFDVHFGTQKAPIFLLGSSASNAAKFFASSSDAIRLVEIQKRHKEKLAEAQREKGRLESESKQLNAELELLEPVVELDRQLEFVEQAFDELTQHDATFQAATKCQAALEAHSRQFVQLAAEAEALSQLTAPPELVASSSRMPRSRTRSDEEKAHTIERQDSRAGDSAAPAGGHPGGWLTTTPADTP